DLIDDDVPLDVVYDKLNRPQDRKRNKERNGSRFDDAAVTADKAMAALAPEKGHEPQPKRPRADLKRLRRLLDDDISLERTWQELNETRKRPAPQVTVEALMFSLRSGGAALEQKDVRARLSRVVEPQLHEICARLDKLTVARAWTSEETALLTELW